MNISGINYDLLSEDEIFELKLRFDEFADKHTKKICMESFKIIIREFGYIATIEELHDIASETNHAIDFIYLLVIIGRIKRKMQNTNYIDELITAFDDLDIDKNGTIELNELLYSMPNQTKTEREELIKIFHIIDKDHDQHITRKEYLEFLYQKK